MAMPVGLDNQALNLIKPDCGRHRQQAQNHEGGDEEGCRRRKFMCNFIISEWPDIRQSTAMRSSTMDVGTFKSGRPRS